MANLGLLLLPNHGMPKGRPKRAFPFHTIPPPENNANEPDLPTNMLTSWSELSATSLSAKSELETIFWEVRGHDGCYRHDRRLRVRLHDSTDFTTTLSTRVILEFTLQGPKQTTLSVVLHEARCPGQHILMQSRYTGINTEMLHFVWVSRNRMKRMYQLCRTSRLCNSVIKAAVIVATSSFLTPWVVMWKK